MIQIFKEFIDILNFPMPPTCNKQLMFGQGRGRFIKSKEARQFDEAVALFKQVNLSEANQAYRKLFVGVELNSYVICCNTDFVFPYEKLFTKVDTPKIIDANNRLKSTIDGVSHVVSMDDKYFFSGSYQKIACKNLKDPYVNIRLSLKKTSEFVTMVPVSQVNGLPAYKNEAS